MSPEPDETLLRKAEQLLVSGQSADAAAILAPLAHRLPKADGIQLLTARAFRDSGNTELALARYKAAAAVSKSADVWREFVIELLKAGQKSRARKAAAQAPVRGEAKKSLLALAKSGLRTTAAASGGVAEAQLTEVKSLLQAGRPEAAAERAQHFLQTHPDSAFLHNVLGLVALSKNEAAEAEERFRKTIELSPGFAGAFGNLGLALIAQDNYDAAIQVLKRAAVETPGSIEVRTNLASAYLEAKEYDHAAEAAEAARRLSPNDQDVLQILCKALNKLGRHDESLDQLKRLTDLQPIPLPVLEETLIALEGTGRDTEALEFAEKHAGVSPDFARRHGSLLAQLGRIDEAAEVLRAIILRHPKDANAFLSYCSLRKCKRDDPVLEHLERFVQSEDNTRQKGLGYFALAKAQMDLNDDARVMETLLAANTTQAASTKHSFDAEISRQEVAELIANWDAQALTSLQGAGAQTVQPVFIIGMPRSGSTLLDQVLCAHPRLTGVGEDSVVAPEIPISIEPTHDAIRQAGQDGANALRRVSGSGMQVVDKFLYNFLRVGALASAFPRARFLQTVRDPRAIAFSIYSNSMKVDGHSYSTRLEDIAEFFLAYERLMDHWHAVLGPRIREVRYEDMVSNPEGEVRRLLEWLELPWDDACLTPQAVARRVKTLSSTQVRGDITTKSVDKWRRFEDGMAPFIQVLKEAGRL
ncbi:MAG: sulfotransferase [Pseudomonadota bacterium]